MPRPPSPTLVARVEAAWAAVRPAVIRTGSLEPTLVFGKGGREYGVPLRPALFRSAAFLRANRSLCQETAAFAGLAAGQIGRLTPGSWAGVIRRRLRSLRPDWVLLLALVAKVPGERVAAGNRAILLVGSEAGGAYAVYGVLPWT